VITEQLSPLYVSIHATDPDVRTRLLRNRRGATSLRWLAALLDAGIEVHGQVVVCPGVNDGDVLDDTLLGVLDRYPRLASVGVVPLGVSDHTTEPDMRVHTVAEAQRVVDVVDEWQARFLDVLGRRLVYAADEYYLMAGRPFPPLADYDELAQHENGIGMARELEAELTAAIRGDDADVQGTRTGFFAWVDGAPAEGYRAPRLAGSSSLGASSLAGAAGLLETPVHFRGPRLPVTILTGEYGARVLEPLREQLATVAGVPVDVLPVANRFFGGNIAVTGLLTGADLAAALADAPTDVRFLLPDVTLSGGRFLDGLTPADLPRPVEIVATDGASLVGALR
jgi:NifB/MoaA-like Fe-S oxidoreductase